jgi:hypothetical protein
MTLTDLQVYYLVNYIRQLSDTGENNVLDILDDLSSILGGTFLQWEYAYSRGSDLKERRGHLMEF